MVIVAQMRLAQAGREAKRRRFAGIAYKKYRKRELPTSSEK